MNFFLDSIPKEELRKEILETVKMPDWEWLDITDGFNLSFNPGLLTKAVIALLTSFYKIGIRDVNLLVTCEASGNTLIVLGALMLSLSQNPVPNIAPQNISALTFRKTAEDEKPMFDLFRSVSSPSHGNRIQNISTRPDFLKNKRVLMLDDVLREGNTAAAIKNMVESVNGTFLGLGVLFRKMWLEEKQLENLGQTPIISLIDIVSPNPELFQEAKISMDIASK